MKKNPVIPIIDGLISKAFYDRHHNKNLGYYIMEECIKIAEKENKAKPIKKVGKLKIGDEFVVTLMASEIRRYKVVRFPTENTVYGEFSNLALGAGSGYYPDVLVPIEIVKKIKPKKEKLPKIKVGEYFKTRTNNTIYKCSEKFDDGCISGTNKLMFMGANTNIKIHRSNIIVTDKESYKKQHKAEKTYKEKQDENKKVAIKPKHKDSKNSKKKNKKKK